MKYQIDKKNEPRLGNKRDNDAHWMDLHSIGQIVAALYAADTEFVIIRYNNWEICFDPTWNDDETCCAGFVYDVIDYFDRGDQDPDEFFFAPTPEDIPDTVREIFNYTIAMNHKKIRALQEQNLAITNFCKK